MPPTVRHQEQDPQKKIVQRAVKSLGSTEEPTTILKTYREEFLTGRKLDLTEVNETIEGETSTIFVGRHTLWDDANSEIKSLNDIRHPLEVQFYGEQSEDFGGPRKEFFRLALNHIRTSFLVQGVPVKLLRSSALIEDQSYYTAGIIVGLSALQNGPCANFLGSLLDTWPQPEPEEYSLFRNGLEKVGLWQLIKQKPTLLYLFRDTDVRLTVSKLVNLLKPRFSEAGSNRRSVEEKVYSSFIRFIRQVAAGRHDTLKLSDILAFSTGSEEEPVLGFEMEPSIHFNELPGDLPTASTCINQLNLPLAEHNDDYIFDRLKLAFVNSYFGLQ